MIGTDPAIEAAQRALDGDCSLEAAAREALEPIRARHQPHYQCGGPAWCTHDGLDWPCPDALDTYTTEELENHNGHV